MEPISYLPRPIGSPAQHKPLQRVLPSNKAIPQTQELAAAHPLLFTQSPMSPKSQIRQEASVTSSDTSNGDSCYSSCSEESHASLSRESSDSATRDFVPEVDEKLLEFATKLGYSESSLRIVLEKLGPDAEQNSVLSELIQLGKSQEKNFAPSNCKNFEIQSENSSKLRPIVIDGSNIAMTHGHKEFFSCKGIRESVDFFVKKGHEEIFVFVPQFRRESPRADCPITDQHILLELENEKMLIWTPARRVGGRRIVCHDDRYILKTAEEKDAIIVSNDEYRDLIKENPQYRPMVEQRLLMYSFVDGKFMPPDDPLGRRGPKLDQFLSFGPSATNAQLCPYAKKCTYGNKCKYYHPERKNGVRQSVTDRLTNGNRGKQNLRERPSMIYEGSVTRNGRHNPVQSSLSLNRNQVSRTQSLNVPLQSLPPRFCPQNNFHNNSFAPNHIPNPVPSNMNLGGLWNPLHHPLNRNFSSPLRNNFEANLLPPGMVHQLESDLRSNSLDDFGFPQNIHGPFSSGVWGESMFSLPNPPMVVGNSDDQRSKLQYHLCQLFPESTVIAVMSAHPDETDAQKLCQMIIAFQKGFENQ
ncbi:hypothetical protein FO519_004140 [Halicephalobus sp. NKZ332]|nr:hypothetical protein FO519_004140 [Halicephalobus sp. NKZ332]